MTNTITKERRDAIRAILSTNPDSYFKELTLALIDALDAAEARAAQADHAASCLADMVKELQAVAEAKMGEPVAYADRYVVERLAGNDECGTLHGKPQDQFSIPLYAAPPDAEPVKVKPLTWTQSNVFGRQKRRGTGIFGEFVAFEVDDLSPEEIARKEAEAQAGYNASIRSALVSEKETE